MHWLVVWLADSKQPRRVTWDEILFQLFGKLHPGMKLAGLETLVLTIVCSAARCRTTEETLSGLQHGVSTAFPRALERTGDFLRVEFVVTSFSGVVFRASLQGSLAASGYRRPGATPILLHTTHDALFFLLIGLIFGRSLNDFLGARLAGGRNRFRRSSPPRHQLYQTRRTPSSTAFFLPSNVSADLVYGVLLILSR
jgi:hypothetical protein